MMVIPNPITIFSVWTVDGWTMCPCPIPRKLIGSLNKRCQGIPSWATAPIIMVCVQIVKTKRGGGKRIWQYLYAKNVAMKKRDGANRANAPSVEQPAPSRKRNNQYLKGTVPGPSLLFVVLSAAKDPYPQSRFSKKNRPFAGPAAI